MNSWSELEVELIVSDYFDMLLKEIQGLKYKKSEHRKKIAPLLNNRSEGSIEFKHQNISAVLINFGQPYIKGYLPRFNYQKILENKVIEYIEMNRSLETYFEKFANDSLTTVNIKSEFEKLIVQPPTNSSNQSNEKPLAWQRSPIKVNYLEKEQRNQILGLNGERFALDFEIWSLRAVGKENLADQVRWISQEEGDGAGFDILSKNLNGTDKYIEVKTTKLGKETPIYFTQNELVFSQDKSDSYHLYRLFNFSDNARMFIKDGRIDSFCDYTPTSYKGYF